MEGTRGHNVKQNKPDSETKVSHAFYYWWNLERKRHKSRRGALKEEKNWGKCGGWKREGNGEV
jgi:hypothetical protein